MEKLEYAPLGEAVWHHVLPNGLHIYVDVRPEYEKQFAFFAARCGGMNLRFRSEDGGWTDVPAGVAHFLEHKMFDTEDGSAMKILAANGASDNAFTGSSMTGYYFECTQGFEENLRMLLSFVSVPYFTKESVDKEQGIIAQEIRMCEDDPGIEVYQQLMEALYVRHPIRTRVAGTVESIAGITAEVLYQCHAAFYRPGNMALCVAGNVDPERVAEIAQAVLPREHGAAPVVDLGQPEPAAAAMPYVEKEMEVSVPLFELGFKGDPPAEGRGLRQQLLAELVGDVLFSSSAPLYNRLYEQGLINGAFHCFYDTAPGCAFLSAGGESRDPERVLEETLKEARRLETEGIDPGLWDRLKRAAYGGMVRQLNSLESVCVDLAQSHFDGEDYLRFPEVFQSIERADGEALLRRWCVRERTALSVIRPRTEESDRKLE